MLGRRERMFFARFPNRYAIAKPKRIRRTQRRRIKPTTLSDAANFGTAITKMKRNGIFGLPRLNPNRRFEFTTAKSQLDNLAVVDLFPGCQLWTNKRGIFPSQFRKRSRQFLQPGVICVAAVQHARIGTKQDLQGVFAFRFSIFD